jgi:phage terminase small subunit
MGGVGSGGHNKKVIEKRAMEARGDGRDVGHRRVAPPGKEIVIPGRVNHPIAFDHDTLPDIPDYIEEEGKFYWFQTFDNNPHIHPEVDWPEVAMLAYQYDKIKEFRYILSLSPATVKGKNGEMVAHPLYSEITKCEMLILKIRDRLALNPVARARINLVEVATAGKLSDLQKRADKARATGEMRWEQLEVDSSGSTIGSHPVQGEIIEDDDIEDD